MEINTSDLAFQIARKAFENKVDKGGKPYFDHLHRVAKPFKEDGLLYPVAILHDLLEDCPEWNEDALRHLFSKNIVDTIVILTKSKKEDYFTYIDRISQCSWATKIKLVDLKDNMDITRLESLEEKDFQRLQKYLKAYKILSNE